MTSPVRVVVTDDQALVRGAFVVLVNSAPDLEVVGQAGDGAEAVDLVRSLAPDVVLMDIRMPVMDGLTATRAIAALDSPTKVLVLTTFDLDEYVFAALRAGASGFLVKDTPPAELLEGIRIIARGDALLGATATRQLIEQFIRTTPAESHTVRPQPGSLDVLTEREVEVLTLVARGMANHEIAAALFVAPATAKTHVSRLLTKLGARDRAQLIVTAYESGLVTPGFL
ncbi:response regulator transcription factor [Terrabacter sp. Ter38]|uniref:response regulator n=1 Tax=Terrabacter sp. Ter38 TaxID=2926030 RepID=UPI0021175388|nr:response regulator transcription factor [Terrabacter sp. Ter38]